MGLPRGPRANGGAPPAASTSSPGGRECSAPWAGTGRPSRPSFGIPVGLYYALKGPAGAPSQNAIPGQALLFTELLVSNRERRLSGFFARTRKVLAHEESTRGHVMEEAVAATGDVWPICQVL